LALSYYRNFVWCVNATSLHRGFCWVDHFGLHLYHVRRFTKPFTNWSKKIVYLVKNYMSVFVGFIIGLSPYFAFELRHGFPNTLSIIKFIFHSSDVGGEAIYFQLSEMFRLEFSQACHRFSVPDRYFVYSQQFL